MHALTTMLEPIRGGWAITLSDGRPIARFTGPGAKRRALHYLVSNNVLEQGALCAVISIPVSGRASSAIDVTRPRHERHR